MPPYKACYGASKIYRFYINKKRYKAGLTGTRACEHLQKFYENEKASIHVIFASSSSKGQILRALLNWMGTLDTPKSHLFIL